MNKTTNKNTEKEYSHVNFYYLLFYFSMFYFFIIIYLGDIQIHYSVWSLSQGSMWTSKSKIDNLNN